MEECRVCRVRNVLRQRKEAELVWNGVRKGWLLSRAQDLAASVLHKSPHRGFWATGGSGGNCCGEIFSDSSKTILSVILWSNHSHSHPEKGLWHGSHVLRRSEKPFSPGKRGHCSAKAQGRKALAGDQESGKMSGPAWVFKCLWWVVADYCYLKSSSKAAELPSPPVPGPAVLVVAAEVEWKPHSVLPLPKVRQSSTRNTWQRAASHPWSNWPCE